MPLRRPEELGEGRIRTFEGNRRQIYSLFPLATREPPRPPTVDSSIVQTPSDFPPGSLRADAGSKPAAAHRTTWSWRRDSNPRPADYKSAALPPELRQQSLPSTLDSPKNGRARSCHRSRGREPDRSGRAFLLVHIRNSGGIPAPGGRLPSKNRSVGNPPSPVNKIECVGQGASGRVLRPIRSNGVRSFALPDPRARTRPP